MISRLHRCSQTPAGTSRHQHAVRCIKGHAEHSGRTFAGVCRPCKDQAQSSSKQYPPLVVGGSPAAILRGAAAAQLPFCMSIGLGNMPDQALCTPASSFTYPGQGHSSRSVQMQAQQPLLVSKVQQPKQHTSQDAGLPAVTELKWERPLRVVQYPDPRLRAPNAPIATFGDSLKQLAAEMFTVMYQDDGAGLAAPQVGVNVRLMVYNGEWRGKGAPRPEDQVILVNPRIVSTSESTDVVQEGCLSFHDKSQNTWIRGKVERPLKIKVEAQDDAGQQVSLSLSGWKARIFQHEHDHLAGVLFPDRVLEESFDSIKPELIKMEEEFAAANPGVDVQSISEFRYPAHT